MGFIDKVTDFLVQEKVPAKKLPKPRSQINTTEQQYGESEFISGISHTSNRPLFGQHNIRTIDYAQIRTYLNRNMEAMVPVRVLLSDILSKYEVVSKNVNLIQEVEEQLLDEGFKQECIAAYKDFLLTGEAFLEPVGISRKKAQSLVEELVKSIFPKKSKAFTSNLVEKSLDKAEKAGVFTPTGLYRVRSETVQKEYGKNGVVTGYVQIVQGEIVARWDKSELINFSSYKYDSDIYGFSIMKTMFEDILTLDATNEYVRNIFQNNGTPDFIISPREKSMSEKSPAYKKMKKDLAERQLFKKRGNMLSTAPFDWTKLNSPSDMEFKNLLEHLSQLFAKAWDIPLQRIQGTKDRSDDTTLQAYYERIDNMQADFNKLLNIKYFSRFGSQKSKIQINFKGNYGRNKVRTMTWGQMLYNLGGTSTGEIRELLGMPKDLPLDISDNPFYNNPEALIGNRGSQQNTPGIDNQANGDNAPGNEKGWRKLNGSGY